MQFEKLCTLKLFLKSAIYSKCVAIGMNGLGYSKAVFTFFRQRALFKDKENVQML